MALVFNRALRQSRRMKTAMIGSVLVGALLTLASCGKAQLETPDAACQPTDDNNPCTDDVCNKGQPAHPVMTSGTACVIDSADGTCSAAGGSPGGSEPASERSAFRPWSA